MAGLHSMKQWLWKIAGFILLGIAYLGVVTPGLPFSPFLVGSAVCFSKSSPTMHAWLYNHKLFGPFLTNWMAKRVFPLRLKYAMVLVMMSSIGIMWASNIKPIILLYSAISMTIVAIWAWRYPSSIEEYDSRTQLKKRIGWFK